jgi:hypothetical protein
MAYESIIPPDETARLKALDPRPVNRQGVGGGRRDSNLSRNSPISTQEQSSNSNQRVDGRRRGRAQEAGSGQGDRELSIPPTSNTFTASSNILETIATRFNQARENNRAGAWRQFQRDLMDASPFICPTLIPYKDLISVVADIEKEIKGSSSSQAGKSNEQLLADFLSGGSDLGLIPIPPAPDTLDIGSIVGEGDGVPADSPDGAGTPSN